MAVAPEGAGSEELVPDVGVPTTPETLLVRDTAIDAEDRG